MAKDGDANKDGTIITVPAQPALLHDKYIEWIGGVGEDREEGTCVTAFNDGKLYNVYWDGSSCGPHSYNWKAQEVPLLWDCLCINGNADNCAAMYETSFGVHNGEAYFLYGSPPQESNAACSHPKEGTYTFYRLANKEAEVVGHGSPSCANSACP